MSRATSSRALAKASGVTLSGKSITISAVSTDDYINATEDNSAVLIAGTSTGLAANTSITVTLDDADADTNADHSFTATTNATGAWTTAATDLTAARVQALDEGVMTITASATGAGSDTRTVTYDATVPTLSSIVATDSTVAVTMSEDVYAATTPTATDFKVKSGTLNSETANTVTTITGLPTAIGSADNSFDLTVTTALANGDSVKTYYTQGTNTITDKAGNTLATLAEASALTATATTKAVAVSAVSTDDYINDTEDESAVTISGTSTGLTSGTTVTVGVDGSGTDISGKTGTTDGTGNWSVSLTSAEVKALDASTPSADGEDLTITATATDATSGTRTVRYDSVAPTVSSRTYSATSGGASVDSVIEGSDLFTKITFSEAVSGVTSDTNTARPAIKSKAQRNNADSITEFQYDTIATGTLASEDCQETGTGSNDKKIYSCQYTTPNTLTGWNDLKVYVTNFTDLAGNAGTAETYAGVTDSVGIKQTPAAPTFSFTSPPDGGFTRPGNPPVFSVNKQLYTAAGCADTVKVGTSQTTVNEVRVGSVNGSEYSGYNPAATPFTGGTHDFSYDFTTPLTNGAYWYGVTDQWWYKDSSNDSRCTQGVETGVTMTVDGTLPTMSSVTAVDSLVRVTMSEPVYAGTTPTATDFKVKSGASGSETANAVTTIAGLPTAEGSADNSFDLTVTTAFTHGDSVKVYYTKGTNAVKDRADNEMATLAEASAVTATATVKAIAVSAVSTDDYINDTEDESAVTISGTSTGLTSGTTITVGVDGSGTDISGKTGTTDGTGNWSVSLTSAEVKALDASTPDADGEDLTITATATGATNGTRTVRYDSVAPTVSSRTYSATAGGAAVDSVVEGSDLFTKITFSEAVNGVTSDTNTARPAIKSKAQRNSSDTITEFQYDTIATGTLASEDCQETGTGSDDKKIYSCRYTTPNTLTGWNDLKVYVTNFTDLAGNAGTAETYAGVTDSVGVSQTPAAPSFSFTLSEGGFTKPTVDGNFIFTINTQLYAVAGCADSSKVGVHQDIVNEVRVGSVDGSEYSGYIPGVSAFSGGQHLFNFQFTTPLTDGTYWYGVTDQWWYKDSNNDDRCTQGALTGRTLTVDGTVPTMSSVTAVHTTVTVTMSEPVYASTTPTATDFKVKSGVSGSETANAVTTITGLPTAVGSADNSFDLTVTTAFGHDDSVKVYYTKGTNAVDDRADNELATLAEASALTATAIGKVITVSAISTDDYINNAEDESAVLITGTSTGLASGTTITITVDDADAGNAANHTFTTTTNASGAWTTAATDLTSARIKAFTEGVMTIAASATGAIGGERTVVYDATAPTATVQSVSGGYVDAAEDDSSVAVLAATSEALSGMAFSIADSETTPDTLTKTGARSVAYAEKLSNAMSACRLRVAITSGARSHGTACGWRSVRAVTTPAVPTAEPCT